MTDAEKPIVYPMQVHYERGLLASPPVVPKVVAMKAYEVYCHIYRPQPALVEGNCRGGFSAKEMIAFLYAHTFPKDEWELRVQEAFHGMKGF